MPLINMTENNAKNDVGDEKARTGTNEVESRAALQYLIATDRNRRRWEQQRELNLQIDENDEERNVLRRRNSIYQAVKMTKILLNLQEALYNGKNHDTKTAVEYLNEISHQLFTPTSLLYAPYVVRSVYSLCVYKHSEEVRTAARKCYRKFSPCFGVNVLLGETFETMFQAQVRKFWETQDHISYDSAKYDWKLFEMKKPDTKNENEVVNLEDDEEEDMTMEYEEMDIDNADDKSLIKKELHIEVKKGELDENVIVKKELCFEVDDESVDDKNLVKKELMELEGEGSCSTANFLLESGIKIKQEKPDSDIEDIVDNKPNDTENNLANVHVKTEKYDLPELRVKIEPIDLEKLNAEYDSEEDCFILGL